MPSRDRARQVKTTKANKGEDFYRIIGRKGGLKNNKTRFTPETGRLNAQKRWALHKQKEK